MGKEQVHIQATVTLNLNTYINVNDVDIPAKDMECVKDIVVNEVEEKMRHAVIALDTFDTDYVIEEVLINGEYVWVNQ